MTELFAHEGAALHAPADERQPDVRCRAAARDAELVAAESRTVVADERDGTVAVERLGAGLRERGGRDECVVGHVRRRRDDRRRAAQVDRVLVVVAEVLELVELRHARGIGDRVETVRRARVVDEREASLAAALELQRRVVAERQQRIIVVLQRPLAVRPHAVLGRPASQRTRRREGFVARIDHGRDLSRHLQVFTPRAVRRDANRPGRIVGLLLLRQQARRIRLDRAADEQVGHRARPQVEILEIRARHEERLLRPVQLEEQVVRLRIARHGRPAAVRRAVEALRQLLRAVEAPPVGREREFARAGIQRRHLLEPHVDPLNGRRRRQAVAPVLRPRHLHRHRRDGAVRGRLVGEVEAADLARPLPQAHEPVGAVRGVHPVVGHRRAVLLGLFLALRRCLGGKALSRIVDVFVVRRERRHVEPVLDVAVKPVVPERRDRREAAVGDVEVDHVPRVAAVEALRHELGVGIAPAVVHARGRDLLLRAALEPRTAVEALAGRRIRNRERRLHAQHGRPFARLVIGARRPQLRHRRRPRGDHVVDQDEAVGIVHLPGVAALVRQDARAADAEARRLAAVDLRKDAVERERVDPPAVLHVQAVERVEDRRSLQRPVADLHRPERRLAPFGRGELDVVRVVGPFDDELVAFLLHVRERVGVHDVEVHRADAVRVGGRGDVRAEVGTVLRRAEVPHHQLAGLAVRERCLLRRLRADALRRRRPRQRVEAVRDRRRLVRQHHVADVDVLQRPERVRHAALRMLQLVAVTEPEVVHDARRRLVPLVHPPRVERPIGALRAPVRLAGHRTGGGRVVVR